MVTEKLRLQDTFWFHALPATKVARQASDFQSLVILVCGMQTVDAKQPLSVMRLTIPEDRQIEVAAEGPDEKEAVQAMAELLKSMA